MIDDLIYYLECNNIPFELTYGGFHREVVNVELNGYAVIYDPTFNCFTICHIETRNFRYADSLEEVIDIIL